MDKFNEPNMEKEREEEEEKENIGGNSVEHPKNTRISSRSTTKNKDREG